MKKRQKNGFTLIELIVSIGLLSIIMVFMVNLFMEARLMFNDSRNITVFEADKRYIIKTLSTDLSDYTIENVTASSTKIDIRYKELGETKTLEIQKEGNKTYLFYGCKTSCNNAEKSISNYKKLIPNGSSVGTFTFKEATSSSKVGSIKLPITIAGRDESLNVFYSFKEVDNYNSYFMTDALLGFVKDADDTSTEVITTKPAITSNGTTCTNTFAYDGTNDNNLRFVGENPCNFIMFNDESPVLSKKWVIKYSLTAVYDYFDTQVECEDAYEAECVQKTVATGGWRIIGVMNNVDNGSGKKETRIKITRAGSLGSGYDWNPCPDYNNPYQANDYSKSVLMQELNGDYLNTSLTQNTTWASDRTYDYTKGLKSSAQGLIANAKWYLGGFSGNYRGAIYNQENNINLGDFSADGFYNAERGKNVWGSLGQACNDGACPRATEWTGKVALPYASDYGFASNTSDREYCIDNNLYPFSYGSYSYYPESPEQKKENCYFGNWIPNQYLLTPDSNMSYHIYGVSPYYPYFASVSGSASYPVHPTMYLRSDVIITGGDGSMSNPYTVSLDA